MNLGKLVFSSVVLVALSGMLVSLSWSQNPYAGDVNKIDAAGKRQGQWFLTAGMLKLGSPWMPEQIVWEGSYQNSKPTGRWSRYDHHSDLITESIYDSISHYAASKMFLDNKLIAETNYNDKGSHEGADKRYYIDGQIQSEMTWKDGRLDGPAKTYYPNGQVCEEGMWKHSYWQGGYKLYSNSGQLLFSRE